MAPRPSGRRTARNTCGALLAALLAAWMVNGCSAHGSSSRPVPSGSASGSASAAPARTVTLDERAAGTVVKVGVGTAVLVRLHSTYWSAPTSSDALALAPVGKSGSTSTGTCEPGAGCGIAAADFAARRTGTAHITAHRDSCGEAMRCGPGQGSYAVTVEIG
ncbi:hypothetical protein [Streptomyces violascens]|uniref:hypothetical protein n=1 Tax=Streptomyces violascens TaxID=67381 RepID=UPI00364807B4